MTPVFERAVLQKNSHKGNNPGRRRNSERLEILAQMAAGTGSGTGKAWRIWLEHSGTVEAAELCGLSAHVTLKT